MLMHYKHCVEWCFSVASVRRLSKLPRSATFRRFSTVLIATVSGDRFICDLFYRRSVVNVSIYLLT